MKEEAIQGFHGGLDLDRDDVAVNMQEEVIQAIVKHGEAVVMFKESPPIRTP